MPVSRESSMKHPALRPHQSPGLGCSGHYGSWRTLRALPDFRRAVWSVTAPGGRLQARSKKQSKEVGIKSISPTVSAKFHQVPGAQGKGVSWGTRGRQWRVGEEVGGRESWTRSHWGVRGGKAAARSPACRSGAGSRLQGFSGLGSGRWRPMGGTHWPPEGGRLDPPEMELQSTGRARGRV